MIPFPTEWTAYVERPEARGKRLGIVSHLFAREASHSATRAELRHVVDTAIQEPTCLILKAAQSISEPSHFILYEVWSDYDEFFTVQLSREYRGDFAKRLRPLSARPAAPEFFLVLRDTTPPEEASDYTLAVVSSALAADSGNRPGSALPGNLAATLEVRTDGASFLLHSINDPNHFVAYEEWPEMGDLDVGNFWNRSREKFEGSLEESARIESRMEIFEVFHDPGKNSSGQPAAADPDQS